jgi:hypothetical protein
MQLEIYLKWKDAIRKGLLRLRKTNMNSASQPDYGFSSNVSCKLSARLAKAKKVVEESSNTYRSRRGTGNNIKPAQQRQKHKTQSSKATLDPYTSGSNSGFGALTTVLLFGNTEDGQSGTMGTASKNEVVKAAETQNSVKAQSKRCKTDRLILT